MFWLGTCSPNIQRTMSAPMCSKASFASIAFPHDLCISRPVSSRTRSYVRTRSYGLRRSSGIAMKPWATDPSRTRCDELASRADDVQNAAFARVERQRQSEVALARDVPVAHVPKPVVHPLRVEGRCPFDRRVRVEQRLPDLVARDEPVVDDAEHQRRRAAP